VGVRACAYPVLWRAVAGLLATLSRGSLPAMAVIGLLAERPVPLLGWVHMLVVFALLPGIAAWLIGRAFAVDVEVLAMEIVLRRSDLRLEIPCAAIERVTPWTLPLPGPGFSLWMRSGRRLRYGMQTDDPMPLLSAVAEIGGVQTARSATGHPNVVYPHARGSVARWLWYHLLAKFVLFALLPPAVWFNAHRHIAYGGLLGQYYLEGRCTRASSCGRGRCPYGQRSEYAPLSLGLRFDSGTRQ
jgi:apolipoprotein N-acyltransferase